MEGPALSAALELLAEVAAAGCRVVLENETAMLSGPHPLDDDLLGRLRAHKPELLALLSANDDHDQAPEVTGKPCAVTLEDSALGEPVVFVSGPEAAAWPEVTTLAFPVFDRDELAELAKGAGLDEWKAVTLVKKQMPGARVDGFEAIGG